MNEGSKTTKIFCLTEAEKAAQLRVSASFLQKDRRKAMPSVPFKRYGRSIRYSADD